MSGPDLAPFLSQKRAINDDYAAKVTANQFSRQLSKKRGARDQADFTQGFRRQTPGFAAGYAHRGLGNSGVFTKALGQFTGDFTQGLGRMQQNNAAELASFDFRGAEYAASRDQALGDIELQKAQMIANTAQQINALRPLMGGL